MRWRHIKRTMKLRDGRKDLKLWENYARAAFEAGEVDLARGLFEKARVSIPVEQHPRLGFTLCCPRVQDGTWQCRDGTADYGVHPGPASEETGHVGRVRRQGDSTPSSEGFRGLRGRRSRTKERWSRSGQEIWRGYAAYSGG